MSLLPNIDPNGLLEYSVVFNDRTLNHMSLKFQKVMRNISKGLKEVYSAEHIAIIPGGGSAAMEALARQISKNKVCLTLRNGFFNYRWTQIFKLGNIPAKEITLTAQPVDSEKHPQYAPPSPDTVIAEIKDQKPDIVFATHVETSAGIILSDEYIKKIANAVHEINGIFVLDCVASGCTWIDMKKTGVDFLITAPQKGWSSSPCAGLIMMNEAAKKIVDNTRSDSFFLDLKKWLDIMKAYENGSHAYHCTMPTDALVIFSETLDEMKNLGLDFLKSQQQKLGTAIRKLLKDNNIKSLSADYCAAPSVVVSYTDCDEIHTGKKFSQNGLQIASGVPLKCGEKEDFKTFRIGLFGIDKLTDIERTVELFSQGLKKVLQDI